MHVHYISPSVVPSRSANSIHVAWQCDGLVRAGCGVTLYAKRSVPDEAGLPAALEAAYGIDAMRMELVTFFDRSSQAESLRIALLAARFMTRHKDAAIVSRNLYAAFYFGVMRRRPLVFETHQLEQGARKLMQRLILTRPWVATVVISASLLDCLSRHHGVPPRRAVVLPDAAPDGIVPHTIASRRNALRALVPQADADWELVCGYFGHLYPGRGIEVLTGVAERQPRVLILICGGNDRDVAGWQGRCHLPNVVFTGHVPHPRARAIMQSVDALLMPYQSRVSIGVSGHDTAGWMSPMKMFEYMASGVPIVASDLPALREVLIDHRNALLVAPDRLDGWLHAVDSLRQNPHLGSRLGTQAHTDYRERYTWTRRAEALVDLVRTL